MAENINEHDKTKQMMDIMRGGYKGLLREFINTPSLDTKSNPQTEPAQDVSDDQLSDTKTNSGDDDSLDVKPGDSAFQDELKKLQDTVDPRVSISNFKIYPMDNNVIIEGTFLKREDENSGIKFKMSLAKGDIETSMTNIELSDKVSLLLQKLKGYYENWVDEWALKLSNEYKPKQD